MTTSFAKTPAAVLLFFMAPILAHANETDRSQYHLFNPIPRAQMREMVTDRPDKTEAAITVDPGHFQLETDLVTQVRDSGTTRTSYMVNNLKAGLTDSFDLQWVFGPWNNADGVTTAGEHTLRLKWNWIGNNGGDFAGALMPFVNLNTGEGGLIIPFSHNLPSDFSLGWMIQPSWVKSDATQKFYLEWITSITVGHDIWGNLAGYLELFSSSSNSPDAQWISTFDAGLTYGICPDVQLDVGANIGLTEAADDWNPFVGLSARI